MDDKNLDVFRPGMAHGDARAYGHATAFTQDMNATPWYRAHPPPTLHPFVMRFEASKEVPPLLILPESDVWSNRQITRASNK